MTDIELEERVALIAQIAESPEKAAEVWLKWSPISAEAIGEKVLYLMAKESKEGRSCEIQPQSLFGLWIQISQTIDHAAAHLADKKLK